MEVEFKLFITEVCDYCGESDWSGFKCCQGCADSLWDDRHEELVLENE